MPMPERSAKSFLISLYSGLAEKLAIDHGLVAGAVGARRYDEFEAIVFGILF